MTAFEAGNETETGMFTKLKKNIEIARHAHMPRKQKQASRLNKVKEEIVPLWITQKISLL